MRTDAAPLIEAKKEYIEQLQQLIAKKLYGIFYEFFIRTVETNDDVELIFSEFQKQMEDIRHWNSDKVDEYTRTIVEDDEFFSQLITTVLILKTKIMTSFKIDNQQKNVQLKVPSNEHFIHRCFMIVGNHFYNNPFVFVVDDNKRINTERYKDCMNMIHSAIEETITFFVPVKSILKEYIGVKEPEGVTQEDSNKQPKEQVKEEPEPILAKTDNNEVRTVPGLSSASVIPASASDPMSQEPLSQLPELPIVASPLLSHQDTENKAEDAKDVQDSDVYPDESMVPYQGATERALTPEDIGGERGQEIEQERGYPSGGGTTTFDSDSDSESDSRSQYEYEPSENTRPRESSHQRY